MKFFCLIMEVMKQYPASNVANHNYRRGCHRINPDSLRRSTHFQRLASSSNQARARGSAGLWAQRFLIYHLGLNISQNKRKRKNRQLPVDRKDTVLSKTMKDIGLIRRSHEENKNVKLEIRAALVAPKVLTFKRSGNDSL